jgi:HAD superfamily hydrolase (TIGR01490 family)
MQKIAIYDMDRTITRYATFGPFLVHACWRHQPWRLPLFILFAFVLIGVPLKLHDRKSSKELGFRLIIGRRITPEKLRALASSFADKVTQRGSYNAAKAQIAADRADGNMLVLATASPDFYVGEIAARLGFDHVIATRQAKSGAGEWRAEIESANCYGPEKRRRVEEWMGQMAISREAAQIRFYSDHHSDLPVFELADACFATNPNAKLRAIAQARGWPIHEYAQM